MYVLGDVRMLLSLACDCLNFSMDKYSNALTSSSNNNDNNGAAEHGNPLENLDGNYLPTIISHKDAISDT